MSSIDAVEFANRLTESVARQNPQMNLPPYFDLRNLPSEHRGIQPRCRTASLAALHGAEHVFPLLGVEVVLASVLPRTLGEILGGPKLRPNRTSFGNEE